MDRSVYWTPDVLEEVRRRCDIVEVISDHVPLRRQGRNLVGRCPFHDDRSPSFSVSPDKQLYYCFGCQAAGDVFSFVMRREGLDFAEAVAALARRAGVRLPEREVTPAERRRWQQREAVYRALDAAAAFYHRELLRSPAAERARRYVAGRGLAAQTVELFGLGYAPADRDSLFRYLSGQGFPTEVLQQAGLVSESGEGGPGRGRLFDRFRDRVMFPIRDEQGRVVGFGGRVLDDGEPKYLNSPETPFFSKRTLWFGLDRARGMIRETGLAIVMEGYLDVITAHQHGFTNAVASLGTALTAEQAAVLRRHARLAVIAYDADAAGAQATQRGMEVLRRAGCEVRVARVPSGKDPDEFIRANGAEAFRRVIEGALPLLEYVFEQAAAGRDLTTVEGKVAVVREVAPALAAEENEVARAGYISRFADRLGVLEEALRRELRRRWGSVEKTGGLYNIRNAWDNSRGPVQVAAASSMAETARGQGLSGSPYRRAEARLIGLLLRHPEHLAAVGGRLEPNDFEDEGLRRLAEVVLAAAGEPSLPEGAEWLDRFGDPAEREAAAALLMEGEAFAEPARAIADCVERLMRRRREREIAFLERTIRELVAAGRPVPPEMGERWQELHRAIRGASRQGGGFRP